MSDLNALITAAKPGDTITLTAGIYPCPVPVVINKPVTIAGPAQGSAIVQKVANATAPSISLFEVTAPNVTLSNLHLDSDKPIASHGPAKVGYYGVTVRGDALHVTGCFIANVDDGIHCGGTNTNTVISGCFFDSSVRGVNVWVAGKLTTIENSYFGGSQQEHNIRMDDAGAQGLTIVGCELTNSISGKETLTIRDSLAPGNIKVSGCSFTTGWVRLGAVSPTATVPDNLVTNMEISDCTFYGGSWLEIDQGVRNLSVVENTFIALSDYVPIHTWGPHITAVIERNTRIAIPGLKITKPMVRLNNLSPTDSVVESGSVEK
jgi:hypothetical protein